MKWKYYLLALVCGTLVFIAAPATAIQLLDVLFLSNGTSVSGVIMEEEPGKSLVLETDKGDLVRYGYKDIERIEKQFLDEDPLIQNRDVVFLKDGVVFRGRIVGRVPDKEIRLELENGQLLDFKMSEVFKITKEQVATGVVEKAVIKPKKEEKKRIEIQIQIALDQLSLKQDRIKESKDSSEKQGLQDEVDRLKEQIDQMEEQNKQAESEAAEEEAKFAAIESELGVSREELLGAAAELEQRIASCDSPQVKERLAAKYEELKHNINEVLARAAVIALVEQPDPRLEKLELEEKTTNAIALAQNKMWRKREYKDQWNALVAELPYEQRRVVYRETRESNPISPMLFNLIPILQLGSWRQQDYFGALLSMGATLAGAGVLVGAYAYAYTSAPDQTTLNVLMYGGAGVTVAGYAFGLISPFYYVVKHNQKLRDALELDRREDEMLEAEVAVKETGYVFPAPSPQPAFRLELVRFEY